MIHKTFSSPCFLLNSALTGKALGSTSHIPVEVSRYHLESPLKKEERNRNEPYFSIQLQKVFNYTKCCPALHWIPAPAHKIMCEICSISKIEAIKFYRCLKFIYNHPEMTRKELQAAITNPGIHYHFRTKEK